MLLPSEILELIVLQSLDSCQTTVSWTRISPIFQELVAGLLGVVVLEDGVRELQNVGIPFDYKKLMGRSNTLYICTDYSNVEQLLEFIKRYMHLLIIIESNRHYSDVLASLLAAISENCNVGTTICVIYCNLQNYLSKLYFRAILPREERVIFSELHIVGKTSLNGNQLFDINTLFERTYLYHLRNICSLDVHNKDHRLISLDLNVISQLTLRTFDEEWDNYFMECPNLRKIENTKYPIRTSEEPFRLPKCESIALTHNFDGRNHQPINGSQVSGELALVLSLRCADPEFYNLHFPNLKKLRLVLNDSEGHTIRFHGCRFDSLESLDCRSSLIPWDDLAYSGAHLKHVVLSLNASEQVRWLCECPYQLERISITSYSMWFPNSIRIPYLPLARIKCQSVDLEIKSVWHCYLYHTRVQRNLDNISDLRIAVKGASLLQSILDNRLPIGGWGIDLKDECIVLKVPSINHFSVSLIDGHVFPVQDTESSASSSIAIDGSSTSDYSNIFFHIPKSSRNYALPSSRFQSSTLLTFDSGNSSRTDNIADLTSYSPHFRSTNDSFVKACKFVPFGMCPETITVNLPALDASIISWEEVRSNRIMLLRVLIEAPEWEVYGLRDLIQLLSEQIIHVLKYPYNKPLEGMIIERFQVAVNFRTLGPDILSDSEDEFAAHLERHLSLKGHNIRVFTESNEEDCHISVLLSHLSYF